MPDFWRFSGYRLLLPDASGRLPVSDDFLRAFWLRPRRAVPRAGGLGVRRFTGAAVSIQPVQRIDDQRWVWHVGLDSAASALLNDLDDGKEIEEVRRARLLALFRLEFRDAADMVERVRGPPVYLGLAMTAAQRLKLKPPNLLINCRSRGRPDQIGSVLDE